MEQQGGARTLRAGHTHISSEPLSKRPTTEYEHQSHWWLMVFTYNVQINPLPLFIVTN
jgi:hypothetical protein